MSLRAVYMRQLTGHGCWLGEEPVELTYDVGQIGDIVCVAFTSETLERLAALGLTTDELVGCEEAAEQAFWENEEEQCRRSNLRQRLGLGGRAA